MRDLDLLRLLIATNPIDRLETTTIAVAMIFTADARPLHPSSRA